jgi:hypothetical protein
MKRDNRSENDSFSSIQSLDYSYLQSVLRIGTGSHWFLFSLTLSSEISKLKRKLSGFGKLIKVKHVVDVPELRVDTDDFQTLGRQCKGFLL